MVQALVIQVVLLLSQALPVFIMDNPQRAPIASFEILDAVSSLVCSDKYCTIEFSPPLSISSTSPSTAQSLHSPTSVGVA